MPFVYILRDTRLKRNEFGVTPRLDTVDRRLKRDKRRRRKKKIRGHLFLIYFEYFPTKKAAQARRRYFQNGPGKDQLRRWLQRWDRAAVVK